MERPRETRQKATTLTWSGRRHKRRHHEQSEIRISENGNAAHPLVEKHRRLCCYRRVDLRVDRRASPGVMRALSGEIYFPRQSRRRFSERRAVSSKELPGPLRERSALNQFAKFNQKSLFLLGKSNGKQIWQGGRTAACRCLVRCRVYFLLCFNIVL